MRFLSLFSGIEAASVAWEPMGWQAAGFAEIQPFACALLEQRWPGVPNLGDVTRITRKQVAALGPLDVVCFGAPCQDLSTAGKRKGLTNADGSRTRSGLFFDGLRIFDWARKACGARWALWENVPGAYITNGGRDFAAVVGAMAGLANLAVPDCGWGTEGAALGANGLLEWACLDAQWFGLAQRRKRVFALLDTGNWAGRSPVLLERESVRGHSAPRRKAGEGVAAGAGAGAACYGGGSRQEVDVSPALLAHGGRFDFESGALLVDVAPTLTAQSTGGGGPGGDFQYGGALVPECRDGQRWAVRRLTPRECERLQGFPDDYTRISYRGRPAERCPDGPRFFALGNSWPVPVARWIGGRLAAAHAASSPASGGRA